MKAQPLEAWGRALVVSSRAPIQRQSFRSLLTVFQAMPALAVQQALVALLAPVAQLVPVALRALAVLWALVVLLALVAQQAAKRVVPPRVKAV